MHWVLDVIFREDDSRIRRSNASANFNTLHQFVFNPFKRYRSDMSVKKETIRRGLE